MCIRDRARATGGSVNSFLRPAGGRGDTSRDHIPPAGMAPGPREEAVDGLGLLHGELPALRERTGEGGVQAIRSSLREPGS
eukprot:15223432-Alexandrium_andersonii.AAC.1